MQHLSKLSGEIEMDETMFGGRVPGKRGWGAAGKHIVFGIYQRNGKVLTFPITSRGNRELVPLYTFLNIRGDHVIISKEKGKPRGRNHINGIEGFWSYAKNWLYHYRGVPKKRFHIYLKEIEWRFNNRDKNLVKILRNYLNQRVVKEHNLVQF
jgi:transposase